MGLRFRFSIREQQIVFVFSLKFIFIHKFKMVREDKASWKAGYFTKIVQLLDEYPKCFLVEADNVGSKQMQQIRISLRGHAVVLMGKNTMMRKAIRGHLVNNPKLECLMNSIKGNVGFVSTKEDLVAIRDMIMTNRVKAPAKAGALAPLDVKVPAQNTGLGPEKTSFFQALDIPDDDLKAHVLVGIRNIAALCLKIGYPTVASVPHSIINGLKNCMAVAAVTDITFKEAEQMKAYLADPSAFAVAAPVAAAAVVEEAAAPEPEEEEDDSMDGGIFDMFG